MRKFLLLFALCAPIAVLLGGCSGTNSSQNGGGGAQSGSVFVVGEDAPLPSVVSFNITLKSITLNNSSTTVQVLSQPTTVDFGKLMGLRSLLAFNAVPPGTYTSATFTLASPVISYLNTSTNPPSLTTLNGTLTSSTVTVAFPSGNPMVVSNNQLAGLHMDFDLHQSLATDNSGNITGTVTPVIDITAVSASDKLGKITEFVGSVLSLNTSANSFSVQGPYGFQRTIDVTNQTQYNGTFSLASISVNAIVALEGILQADGSILASSVEVITSNQAFISGRVLAVSPGPVVTMFVGEELPDLSPSIPVDSVYTVDLSGLSSNDYEICFFENLFTQGLFDRSSLVQGQRILVGGTYQSGAFTPAMVSLRLQGLWGSLVQGSVAIANPPNQGSFQLDNDFMSYLVGGPFTVRTFNGTDFLNLNGLSQLANAGSTHVVAVGLVFNNGQNLPVADVGVVAVRP